MGNPDTLWLEILTAGYTPFFVLAALIAIFGVVTGFVLNRVWNKDHRVAGADSELGRFASVNGWETLKQGDRRRGDKPPLSLFETSAPVSVENLLFRREGEIDAFLFQFVRTSGTRELSTTVIAFRIEGADFDPLRMTPVDADFPYEVEGELHESARARFQRKPGWCVEVTGGWIMFHHPLQAAIADPQHVRRNPLESLTSEGGRLSVRALPRFIDEAWLLLEYMRPGHGHHAPTIDPTHR